MKISAFSKVSVFLLFVAFMSACKKDKTPEVYFTASGGSTTRGGDVITATIELSEPTNDIVELNFESTGTNPIYFGSINQVFFRDDSSKFEASIDQQAFIEDQGHIKLTAGTQKVTITFTAKYDNFPHAAENVTLKIASAKNATIRQSSSTFNFQIAEADFEPFFTSVIFYNGLEHDAWAYSDTVVVDTIIPKTGTFTLSTFQFTKAQGQSTYNLELNYSPSGGNSKIPGVSVRYRVFSRPALGSNLLNCSNSAVEFSMYLPQAMGVVDLTNYQTYTCNDLINSSLNINLSEGTSPAYGTYNTFTAPLNLENTDGHHFQGDVNSQFILFN